MRPIDSTVLRKSGEELWRMTPDQPTHFLEDLRAARTHVGGIRHISGPYAQAFSDVLQESQAALQATFPQLPYDAYFDYYYQSYETRALIENLNINDIRRPNRLDLLNKLRQTKNDALQTIGLGASNEQIPEPVRLSQPPFRWQGEEIEPVEAATMCFSTCFSMVHEAITAERISELALYAGLKITHNAVIVGDNNLLNIFALPAYQKRHDIDTRVIAITGSSLSYIGKIASAFQQKNPTGSTHAIVSLGSEVRNYTWHTNVLTAYSDDEVEVHDPRFEAPWGVNRKIPRTEFMQRWAIAFNRVHLVLSRPRINEG